MDHKLPTKPTGKINHKIHY